MLFLCLFRFANLLPTWRNCTGPNYDHLHTTLPLPARHVQSSIPNLLLCSCMCGMVHRTSESTTPFHLPSPPISQKRRRR